MVGFRRLLVVVGVLLCSCKGGGEAQTVTLLSAGEDLAEGMEVEPSQMALVTVSKSLATANTLTKEMAPQTSGKRLRVSLTRGDLLLASYFELPDSRLSTIVQKKGRAVTLSVSGAENLHASDRVDLLAAVPDPQTKEVIVVTQFQNVVVLSPGPAEPAAAGEAFPLRRVTLMLLPEEAEMALVAIKLGGLHVTLRNPEDIDVQEERGRATVNSVLSGERTRALETLRRRVLDQRNPGGVMRSTSPQAPHALAAPGTQPPPAPAPAGPKATVPADTAPVPVMPGRQP